jgi:fumarate reductase flavoprotein subunit
LKRKSNEIFRSATGFRADTLEELAKLCDFPLRILKKPFPRYNELVAQGDDVDFGKRAVYA